METTLLDIDIPVDQIKQAEREIGKARAQIEALKEANKELDKSSDAYTNNAIKIKQLNGEVRTNERLIIANTKANQANKGSIEQLRSQLSTTTTQWAKLSKEERENTDAGKALTKQKLKLTNELKRLEKQTGDTRRNVGNYSEGVKEALQESGLFSRALQAQATAQKVVTAATGGTTKAMKLLKIALAATGIGLVISLIYSLRESLTKTEEGQAKLNKIMSTFSGVLNGVFIALEPLASLIADSVIGFFETLGTVIQNTFGFLEKTLRFLGQDEWANKLANFIDGVGGAADATQKLADAELNLNKARRQQEITQKKFQERAEKLRQIRDDESKSIEERIAANTELGKVLDQQSKKELDLAQKAIEVANLRIKAEGENKDNLDALAEAELKVAEINERITSQRSEQLVNINSLLKEQGKISEDNAKADEDNSKADEDNSKADDEEKRIQEELEMELEAAERLAQEKINAINKEVVAGTKTREQANEEFYKIELAALEAQKALLEQFGQDTLDIESRILEFKVANIEAETEAKTIAAKTDKELTKSTLDATAQAFGEETAIGKIAASAKATINTFEAASAALKLPPPFGQIQAALVTIQGLAQVAKINAVQVPKFATGVIGVDGPGTGTSDSISAKISAGESVMTAKATSKYAPLLASLEKSVGNNPNIGKIGRAKFADGVINAGVNVTRQAAQLDGMRTRDLVSAMSSQPIYVSLTELDEEQIKYNRARSVSVVE